MDCEAHHGVDIVGDISDLSRFRDGEIAEIYASHCLEHFPHVKTLSVLKEWARVLAPGGILYVAVPDFRRAIDIYLASPNGLENWVINYVYGDQGYPTAFHYAGFDFHRLSRLLREAGFSDISRVANFPIGNLSDCSRIVSTVDGQPVSLNMVAIR